MEHEISSQIPFLRDDDLESVNSTRGVDDEKHDFAPNGFAISTPKTPSFSISFIAVIASALMILAFSIGVLMGRRSAIRHIPGTVNQVSVGSVKTTFRYNETFAQAPTEPGKSEPVWDSLIPNGLGYVKGVPQSPDFSVVSVFHQLHCLYTLRRVFHSTSTNGLLEDFDFGRSRDKHVGHCFEYLRQSIMCSADSSIEPAGGQHDDFLGWGFQRQCRDFEQLKDWASAARAFDAHGFLAKELLHDHEM